MIETDEFIKYDYGTDAANFKKYGQVDPPIYDLKKVTGFNILFIGGKTDKLSVPADYIRAKEIL
jgi:hypothetical protein